MSKSQILCKHYYRLRKVREQNVWNRHRLLCHWLFLALKGELLLRWIFEIKEELNVTPIMITENTILYFFKVKYGVTRMNIIYMKCLALMIQANSKPNQIQAVQKYTAAFSRIQTGFNSVSRDYHTIHIFRTYLNGNIFQILFLKGIITNE
ncbi:hypothetical protein SAMN05216469_1365 [Ruminococcus albus]|uniref:Uncharacterized protein n=1 Tax=Ruminococcus albus TaxID=1264 RepID=A0A1H7QDX2_RUMAL|nr:hypothetical protein SAMN05216469_1365 [Ruminococcus albus]